MKVTMKVLIFFFLLSSVRSQQFQVNQSDVTPARASYPAGDVRNCAINLHSGIVDATPPTILEVLPGLGYDNLRNFDMDRVHLLNYSTCKTTSDGKYLLPDGYFVIPQHETDLKFFSEFFQNWYDYHSLTSSSINVGGSLLGLNIFSIGGSFSEESRRVKIQQVHENSVTTRTQLRRVVYTVKLGGSVTLHPKFRKHVYEIAASLAGRQDNLAHYYSELLVREYGTHYLTSIEVGGVFAKNDYVSRAYSGLLEITEKNLTSAAAFSFPGLGIFNGTFSFGATVGSQNAEQTAQVYRQNLVGSDILTIGGPPLTEEVSISKWQNEVQDNLAIIDRSGDPLAFAITPSNFPELEASILRDVAAIVQGTTDRYFEDNNIPGCVDLTDANFNFQANNPSNESCGNGNSSNSYLERSFGGTFQTCANYGREPLCLDLLETNPLTAGFSCPTGYQAILLNSGSKSVTRQYSRTDEECSFIFFCDDVITYYTESTIARYSTYWCAAAGDSQENRGYLFGGYYSSMMNNPFTAARLCPTYYQVRRFGTDVSICTSSDYELGTSRSVKFGGFFSCSVGNPLVTGPNGGTNSTLWTRTCPMGYTQHLITVDNNCEISACFEMGSYGRERLLLPKLPPYRTPQFNPNGSEPIAILGSRGTILIKNTQGEWETYSANDPMTSKLLQTATESDPSRSSSSSTSGTAQTSSTPSAVAIAALVFAILALTALTILIFVIVYKARQWNE